MTRQDNHTNLQDNTAQDKASPAEKVSQQTKSVLWKGLGLRMKPNYDIDQILSCLVLLCLLTLSYLTLHYHTLPYFTLPYLTLPCLTLPCLT